MDPRVKPEDDGGEASEAVVMFCSPLVWEQKTDVVILGLDPRIHPPALFNHEGYVYIVANHKRGTLYIGVTSDLERGIDQHRGARTPGFTSKYGCNQLVWYEEHGSIGTAIQREKSLKRWSRQWKIELIEAMNPDWRDLYRALW